MTDEQDRASGTSDLEAATPKKANRPLVLRSDDLLRGAREVWIEHRDQMYRLRVTSTGKLYLTK